MGNWAKENPGREAGLHGAFMWSQKEAKVLRRDSRGEVEGHTNKLIFMECVF